MIKGVLIDLAGVVFNDDRPIPGAIEAISRLHDAGLPTRYVTNTTRTPKRAILARLARMGLTVPADELFTPVDAVLPWLKQHRRSAHLLVYPDLAEDFAAVDADAEPAVVIGDAGTSFTYEALNVAFRALHDGAPLLALAKNRYFRDKDGELSLDAGPFVAALEFAGRTEALLFGKPAAPFFEAALASMGCAAADTVMVGDDVEADVSGALAAGIGQALLVRTGKYETGAEEGADPPPTATVEDFAAAVDWILARV
jgi:HAD superfamily hydrolase (TIGR01458 family)